MIASFSISDESEAVIYSEEDLVSMTVAQIKSIANERGYKITQTVKAGIIDEFLAQQAGD